MSEQIYVKPATGLKVRRPEKNHAHLPAEGDFVPKNAYWVRRLNDGDVIAAPAPDAAKKTKTKE